jgi:SAM-dependent methyltransferase
MDRLLSDNNSIFYHKDGRPNKLGKFVYWHLNWFDNHLFPFAYDKKLLSLKTIPCPYNDKDWNSLPHASKGSPTRAVGDLFWSKLPWSNYSETLDGLNIVDLGCGDGEYFKRIQLFSNNLIANYTGIDIFKRENWDELMTTFSNVQFISGSMQDIEDYLPNNFNFIISQSALEHFPNDRILFKSLSKIIQSRKKKTIQVHLMPSPSCLKIYRYHGIRHYTPRTISSLISDFEGFSKISLYGLGGMNCNKFHYSLVDKSFTKDNPEYEERLFSVINNDLKLDQFHNASFWALVIESF